LLPSSMRQTRIGTPQPSGDRVVPIDRQRFDVRMCWPTDAEYESNRGNPAHIAKRRQIEK
jgi:hypothetical protein